MMLCLHDDTGRITQTVNEPIDPAYLDVLRERGIAFAIIEGEPDAFAIITGSYVVGGEVRPRPAFPGSIDKTKIKADGADKAVISNLPTPCTLTIAGQPVERKAGTMTIMSRRPARMMIAAEAFPFLPWSVEVEAA